MSLQGRWPLLSSFYRKAYQGTERVTCQAHTTVHDIDDLSGSVSIVNDFWVIFPDLPFEFLRERKGSTLLDIRQSTWLSRR